MSPLTARRSRADRGHTLLVLALLAGAVMVAAACSSGDGQPDDANRATDEAGADGDPAAASEGDNGAVGQGSESVEPTEDDPPSGDVLPVSTFNGQATTIEGAQFELGSLEGVDLILWFWAPW